MVLQLSCLPSRQTGLSVKRFVWKNNGYSIIDLIPNEIFKG
jgi:hypothetical protein